MVCGTTAGAADSIISNQPVTFESNRIGSSNSNLNRIVRFELESNLEASQVPMIGLLMLSRAGYIHICFSYQEALRSKNVPVHFRYNLVIVIPNNFRYR